MESSVIPDEPGNYIFLLQEGCSLPECAIIPKIPEVDFEGHSYQAIYTGIASNSLRQRDYRQHFVGNDASHSTLRKSLGCLFGYDFVPRNDHDSKHKKFKEDDEVRLSEWMRNNLLMAYFVNVNPEPLEDQLIKELNPPLNLAKNSNRVNHEFREMLSKLRTRPVAGKDSSQPSIKADIIIDKPVSAKSVSSDRVKRINRNINFDRNSNNYRCKYNDRNGFELLEVACSYKNITKLFQVESKYLPERDSISFKAYQKGDSFVVEWQKSIEDYIKEVKP